MSDPQFAELVHGTLDVQEPTGWIHLDAVLSVPEMGVGTVRCLDITATDEAGVVLELTRADHDEFARRFIEGFYRRGARAVQQNRP